MNILAIATLIGGLYGASSAFAAPQDCVSPGPCTPDAEPIAFSHVKRLECACGQMTLTLEISPVTGYLAGANLDRQQQCEALCWAATSGIGAPDYTEDAR